MTLRFLPVLFAVLACALWPQGVLLCMGDDGHVEVELESSGCCPSETDDDCVDCADVGAPDQRAVPPIVMLAPPAVSELLTDDTPVADRADGTPPLLPPRDRALEGVKLLV